MPKSKLRLNNNGLDDVLLCPACGGDYLHQGKVEIFNRSEDADEGAHVSVLGDDVRVNRDLAGNPSARRHGMTINFTCELCPAQIQMDISQHKGNTYVGMEYQTPKA